MLMPASEMTQEEINDFCRATSAVYYAVVRAHAARTGMPVLLPKLLCPWNAPPSIHDYDEAMLDEAEKFLLRLGLIGTR